MTMHNVTKLRKIRKAKGFNSAQALAAALGLTEQCVHTWEIGYAAPRKYNGVRLAAVLQTPIETLLEPDKGKTPAEAGALR